MNYLTTYVEQLLSEIGVDSAHTVFGNTIGEYCVAVAVFLLALLVFKIGQRVVMSWLMKISERTATDLDDTFVKMVQSFRPPFYLFLAFWLATQYLNITGIADAVVTAILVVWMVYQAVIIVGILVEDVVFSHFAKEKDETTKSALRLLSNLAQGVMWVLGILLVLSNFGINVTSLMAGAGIAGVAIAFALQGILGDLFSSFSIYFDKPFKVGDFIIVGDTMGVVKHIGIKSTRIASLAGEEITVSNQELTGARIHNYARMSERRVVFSFGVLYETPQEKVLAIPEIVRKIVEGQVDVRFDRAHFQKFGDSSLDFEVVYYVLTSDYTAYMDCQQSINLDLMRRFAEEGIEFAYPTRTIYMANSVT